MLYLYLNLSSQDWCIEHGYTELSPYAGVSGRGGSGGRAAAVEEEEGSGEGEEEYQYDYQEY